jgi:glc operon protein GlcG
MRRRSQILAASALASSVSNTKEKLMHSMARYFTLILMLLASSAFADDLSATQASKIIDGCVAHAKQKSQSHAIAVDDSGGHLIALLRMDGNSSGIAEFAVQKAEAVASWHFSTQEMGAAAKETPGFANAPHVVLVAGGVPVFSAAGQFIGSVGVSGEAPVDDAACAEAGIVAAGFSTKPKKSS